MYKQVVFGSSSPGKTLWLRPSTVIRRRSRIDVPESVATLHRIATDSHSRAVIRKRCAPTRVTAQRPFRRRDMTLVRVAARPIGPAVHRNCAPTQIRCLGLETIATPQRAATKPHSCFAIHERGPLNRVIAPRLCRSSGAEFVSSIMRSFGVTRPNDGTTLSVGPIGRTRCQTRCCASLFAPTTQKIPNGLRFRIASMPNRAQVDNNLAETASGVL